MCKNKYIEDLQVGDTIWHAQVSIGEGEDEFFVCECEVTSTKEYKSITNSADWIISWKAKDGRRLKWTDAYFRLNMPVYERVKFPKHTAMCVHGDHCFATNSFSGEYIGLTEKEVYDYIMEKIEGFKETLENTIQECQKNLGFIDKIERV